MRSRLAISTMSLGWASAGHPILHRLQVAAAHGYSGIELWFDDLLSLAQEITLKRDPSFTITTPATIHTLPLPAQLEAACTIRNLCQILNLTILNLQPFPLWEGVIDRAVAARKLQDLGHWIMLAHELHTDAIHIASTMAPAVEISTDLNLACEDLRAATLLAAAADPPVRISFEALSWGTRIDTWEQSWALVQAIDHENLGLCLDTFNIAGRIFADPEIPGGVSPGGLTRLQDSLTRLAAIVEARKVFFLQVVDAERLDQPLKKGHEFWQEGMPERMCWSRNCRLFYGEHERGAYLPVRKIARVIFDEVGWGGWVSLELFNRRMEDKGEKVEEELAKRGVQSWKKLVEDLNLEV